MEISEPSLLKAIVIGGSLEIGVEAIKSLYEQQYNIHFTYHSNEQKKEELLDLLDGKGLAFKVDLTDFSNVNLFLQQIASYYYDAVIYCAGENPCKLCHDLSAHEILKLSQINFISPSSIFNVLSKNMLENKLVAKKLIYISSTSARKAVIGDSIYGATKIAMERYLASLSLELARFNVRTLCVSPGYVNTKMMHKCREISGTSFDSLIRSVPARKVLKTKEVANIIDFFINDKIITTGNSITLGHGENVF